MFSQLYLTGAVYSLDGSDSLKETMQTSIAAADADKVRVKRRDGARHECEAVCVGPPAVPHTKV